MAEALAVGAAVADAEAFGDAAAGGLFVGPAAGGGGLFTLVCALVCAFVCCVCVFTPVVVLVALETPTPAETPNVE